MTPGDTLPVTPYDTWWHPPWGIMWILQVRSWDEQAASSSSESVTEKQARCTRHGGFLADVQRFAAAAFGVSAFEARMMDPQQRSLLELGYEALHRSAGRRASLQGVTVAVVLGIERPDWVEIVRHIGPEARPCARLLS